MKYLKNQCESNEVTFEICKDPADVPSDVRDADAGALGSNFDGGGGVSDTAALSTASSWRQSRASLKKDKKKERQRAARDALRSPTEPSWPPEVFAAVDKHIGDMLTSLEPRQRAALSVAGYKAVAVAFTARAEDLFLDLDLPSGALQWWHTTIAADPSSASVLRERFERLLTSSLRRLTSR